MDGSSCGIYVLKLPLVISRIFSIVSAESRSVHPWMTKHRHFPKGPYVYGYGYTVFSPQAIIHAEHFIRQKFLVEENRSMFNTVGSIRGLKDEGLIKAFATEQSMVSLYIGHVLVKEALCAAFQGITGIQFREADAELSVSEKKTKMQAITMAIECSLGKKKEFELKYNLSYKDHLEQEKSLLEGDSYVHAETKREKMKPL